MCAVDGAGDPRSNPRVEDLFWLRYALCRAAAACIGTRSRASRCPSQHHSLAICVIDQRSGPAFSLAEQFVQSHVGRYVDARLALTARTLAARTLAARTLAARTFTALCGRLEAHAFETPSFPSLNGGGLARLLRGHAAGSRAHR
eukprot:6254883-Prymnesium_polylepis.2